MDSFLDYIKAVVFGIVEGITEWLPVSSTGHLIILEEFFSLKHLGQDFFNFFLVVIQLAAIIAIIVNFFRNLWPFGKKKTLEEKREIWQTWGKIVIASVPAGVIGLLFNDWMDEHLHNYLTVSITLIVYGVIFLGVEFFLSYRKKKTKLRYHLNTSGSTTNETGDPYGIFNVHKIKNLTFQMAFIIGLAQCLALIPGTSRSGVTIVAALLLSIDRSTASRFSFYLAIPAMVGGSLVSGVSFFTHGGSMTGHEVGVLLVACLVSFIVSILTVRFLLRFIRNNTFVSFGVYRIVLGIVLIILYFAVIKNREAASSMAVTFEGYQYNLSYLRSIIDYRTFYKSLLRV